MSPTWRSLADEIAELFDSAYERPLSGEETRALGDQTGGWPIALQLIGQSTTRTKDKGPRTKASNDERSSFVVRLSSASREALFAYLAQEVLARQPAEIQAFLLRSSVLAELEPSDLRQAFSARPTSAALLRRIERRGLFVDGAGRRSLSLSPTVPRLPAGARPRDTAGVGRPPPPRRSLLPRRRRGRAGAVPSPGDRRHGAAGGRDSNAGRSPGSRPVGASRCWTG